MNLNKYSHKVLMFGPDKHAKGGIASLISTYDENSLFSSDIKYIATFDNVNCLDGLWLFSRSILFLFIYRTIFSSNIVHIHSSKNGSFIRKSILTSLAKFLRYKIIFHLHSGEFFHLYDSSNFKWLYRFIFSNIDLLIVVANKWKEQALSRYNFKEVIVLPNCVDKSLLNNTGNTDSKNIVFMGKVCVEKGVPELIEAFSRIRIDHPDWFLFVAGVGDAAPFVESLGLEKCTNIKFVGWINKQEKLNLLKNAAIFCLPSHFESFGLSVLEAMCFGLPIVSTDVGGIPELVRDNFNGILVKKNDPDALFQALNRLVTDKNVRKKFGERSFEIASEEFSVNVQILRLRKIYKGYHR